MNFALIKLSFAIVILLFLGVSLLDDFGITGKVESDSNYLTSSDMLIKALFGGAVILYVFIVFKMTPDDERG